MEEIVAKIYDSPCGALLLGSSGDCLCLCDWIDGKAHPAVMKRIARLADAGFLNGTSPVIGEAEKELDQYFAGERKEFDIPLRLYGTEFQKQVWSALSDVVYGVTLSYGELSQILEKPDAVRAVANAVGQNPISIIIPCHRIIGSDGKLTGFSGGLAAKRFLLDLETSDSLFSTIS